MNMYIYLFLLKSMVNHYFQKGSQGKKMYLTTSYHIIITFYSQS